MAEVDGERRSRLTPLTGRAGTVGDCAERRVRRPSGAARAGELRRCGARCTRAARRRHGVLRLPLQYQSELVGMILADAGARTSALGAELRRHRRHPRQQRGDGDRQRAPARARAPTPRRAAAALRTSASTSSRRALRRISRELHDGTCQALMAIKLDLALLERQTAGGSSADHGWRSATIRAQVLDVVQSVRQMSHLLYPPRAGRLRRGRGDRVGGRQVPCRRPGCRSASIAPIAALRFTPPIELLVFRIFQEAMINVVKARRRRRVHVRLAVEERCDRPRDQRRRPWASTRRPISGRRRRSPGSA